MCLEGKLKNIIRVCCLLMLVLASLGVLMAQTATPDNDDETTLVFADSRQDADVNLPSSSLFPYLMRMFLVLALVLAAIYGLYILLRRRAAQTQNEDPFIRILGAVPLSPGRSVHVVAVGSRAWLIGSGDGSVSMLTELDDKDLIEAMVKRAEENPKQYKGDFASVLSAMLPGKAGAGKTPSGRNPAGSINGFLGRQKDRLKRF